MGAESPAAAAADAAAAEAMADSAAKDELLLTSVSAECERERFGRTCPRTRIGGNRV